jgi:hypothetical protein
MNKPIGAKIIGKTDNKKYLNYINENSLNFDSEFNTMHGREFHFKNAKSYALIDEFVCKDLILYKKFLQISEDIIDILKYNYGNGKFWKIQFAILFGGGKILPHYDKQIGFALSHRIHIPLLTNKNVIFTINNIDYQFYNEGEIIEINNLSTHSTNNFNSSEHKRIHLIMDYMTSEYIPFIETKKSINFEYH